MYGLATPFGSCCSESGYRSSSLKALRSLMLRSHTDSLPGQWIVSLCCPLGSTDQRSSPFLYTLSFQSVNCHIWSTGDILVGRVYPADTLESVAQLQPIVLITYCICDHLSTISPVLAANLRANDLQCALSPSSFSF